MLQRTRTFSAPRTIPAILLFLTFLPLQSEAKVLPFSPSIGDTLEPPEAQQVEIFTELGTWQKAWWEKKQNLGFATLKVRRSPDDVTSLRVPDNLPVQIVPWLEKRLQAAKEGKPLPVLGARLVFFDGSVLVGRIVAWPGEELVVEGVYGSSRVKLEKIQQFEAGHTATEEKIERRISRDYATRLFLAPTADVLPPGEVTITLNEIIIPTLDVGFGYGLSLGGGAFPFNTDEFGIYWLTPRVRFYQNEIISVGAGAFMSWMGSELFSGVSDRDSDRDWENFGIANGTFTWRGKAGSLTAGLGWAYSASEFTDEPAVYLGAVTGGARRNGFMTEWWFLPGTEPIGIIGARLKAWSFTADMGLMRQMNWGFLGVPWLAITATF